MTDETGHPRNRDVKDLFNLSDRVALVTGGAGYLGTAMCHALAEVGATVIVASRDEAKAAAAAERLPGGPRAGHWGVALNHKSPESIENAFQRIRKRSDHLDVLIDNGQGGTGHDWSEITSHEFNDQLSNASGYFELARRTRELAVANDRPASIILLGSMYGLVGSYPEAYDGICSASSVAYHALKGGIVQMTRHLAVYWARDNVRVNCLSPGPFPGAQAPSQMVDRLVSHSPMGRMGVPEELKGATVFLASDASSYMTGQNLVIDGGWTAW